MDNALTKFKILKYPKSRSAIQALQQWKGIAVIDQLEGQINELYKLRVPSVPDDLVQFRAFRKRYLAGRRVEEVGAWAWYPWSKKLVHILPSNDFQSIRVSRNRYLITDREQVRYQRACVAIAGLSIGSNIATALRLQGGAQFIKLSDFDKLELSNTNRISIGVSHLGEKKIDIIQQTLLEIDPYTKLSLFPRGLMPDSVERFCQGADIIFDEVDNLYIKVLLRKCTRRLRKPLIMLTDNDDGVLVDYYPYHKKIHIPLFHGLPDKEILTAVSSNKSLSKTEMVRLSSRVVGQKNISLRMRWSLKSVGKTLVSWPQLGTAALLSGAVGAYMTRMVVNGHNFRFHRRLIRLNDQLI